MPGPLDIRLGSDRILEPDVFVYLQPLEANAERRLSRVGRVAGVWPAYFA